MKMTLRVGFFAISSAASLLVAGDSNGNPSSPVLTGPQSVTGMVQAQFGSPFGTVQAGSNVSGFGDGSLIGNDQSSVVGEAGAHGTGSGQQMVGLNSSTSSANSTVGSNANVTGAGPNTVAVAGGAGQGNWANIGTGNNFAGGYNETTGTYDGSQVVNGSTQLYGAAGSTGNTAASTIQSPGMAQSTASTNGISYGGSTAPNTVSTATGYGIIAGASLVGTIPAAGAAMTGPFAGGYFQGTATYNGGGQNAAGALGINGQVTGQVSPGGVVSANASLTAAANGSTPAAPQGH